jgi:uncharacterized radical SAM superfamily Fe-S cluster-containing enzyme
MPTETMSLCPLCLRRIPASRSIENRKVYLEKKCPIHGVFKTLLWGDAAGYDAWAEGSEHAAVFRAEGRKSGNCPPRMRSLRGP